MVRQVRRVVLIASACLLMVSLFGWSRSKFTGDSWFWGGRAHCVDMFVMDGVVRLSYAPQGSTHLGEARGFSHGSFDWRSQIRGKSCAGVGTGGSALAMTRTRGSAAPAAECIASTSHFGRSPSCP